MDKSDKIAAITIIVFVLTVLSIAIGGNMWQRKALFDIEKICMRGDKLCVKYILENEAPPTEIYNYQFAQRLRKYYRDATGLEVSPISYSR